MAGRMGVIIRQSDMFLIALIMLECARMIATPLLLGGGASNENQFLEYYKGLSFPVLANGG
jgi:hypothetical protein